MMDKFIDSIKQFLSSPLTLASISLVASFIGLFAPTDTLYYSIISKGILGICAVLTMGCAWASNSLKSEFLEEKFKRHLLSPERWKSSNDVNKNVDYYDPDSDFSICYDSNAQVVDPEFDLEWVRGEFGYHYPINGGASWVALMHKNYIIDTFAYIVFDGSKKSCIAPDYALMKGGGRIYFYVENSLGYLLHKYYVKKQERDYSKNLMVCSDFSETDFRKFDIPVFLNDKEKLKFLKKYPCNFENFEFLVATGSRKKQNELFYENIKRFQKFIKKYRKR
ncbi:hypothetical protein FAI41_01275 [Acetobacteraceae bacterium]|nr:hypothetical protein FAI41_01275 [Acetobacteraceae bacterium]